MIFFFSELDFAVHSFRKATAGYREQLLHKIFPCFESCNLVQPQTEHLSMELPREPRTGNTPVEVTAMLPTKLQLEMR